MPDVLVESRSVIASTIGETIQLSFLCRTESFLLFVPYAGLYSVKRFRARRLLNRALAGRFTDLSSMRSDISYLAHTTSG